MGAREYVPVMPHEPFVTAIVVDPLDNLLGLHGVLTTPHYSDEDLAPARGDLTADGGRPGCSPGRPVRVPSHYRLRR